MIGKLFNFFQGRSTFFAVVLLVSGVTLAFLGKLTPPFVAFGGMLQGWVVAHSAKEDWVAKKRDDAH